MRASVVLPEPDSPMMVKISGFSDLEREAHVAHGVEVTARQKAADREGFRDVVDFEERGHCAGSTALGT